MVSSSSIQNVFRSGKIATIGDAVKGRIQLDQGFYLYTHTGLRRVEYIRWPESDPEAVTGRGLDASSWCVHYGMALYSRAQVNRLRGIEGVEIFD